METASQFATTYVAEPKPSSKVLPELVVNWDNKAQKPPVVAPANKETGNALFWFVLGVYGFAQQLSVGDKHAGWFAVRRLAVISGTGSYASIVHYARRHAEYFGLLLRYVRGIPDPVEGPLQQPIPVAPALPESDYFFSDEESDDGDVPPDHVFDYDETVLDFGGGMNQLAQTPETPPYGFANLNFTTEGRNVPALTSEEKADVIERYSHSAFGRGFVSTDAMKIGVEAERSVLQLLSKRKWVLAACDVGMVRSRFLDILGCTVDALLVVNVKGKGPAVAVGEVKTFVVDEKVDRTLNLCNRVPSSNGDTIEPIMANTQLFFDLVADPVHRTQLLTQAVTYGTHFAVFFTAVPSRPAYTALIQFPLDLLQEFVDASLMIQPAFAFATPLHKMDDRLEAPQVLENMIAALPVGVSDLCKDLWRSHLPLLLAVARWMKGKKRPLPPLHLFKLLVQFFYNKTKGGVDLFSKFLERAWKCVDAAIIRGFQQRIVFRFGVLAPVIVALILSRMMLVNVEARLTAKKQASLRWIRRQMEGGDCVVEIAKAGVAIAKLYRGDVAQVTAKYLAEENAKPDVESSSIAETLSSTPIKTSTFPSHLHPRVESTPAMIVPSAMTVETFQELFQQYQTVQSMTDGHLRANYFREGSGDILRKSTILLHNLQRRLVDEESSISKNLSASGVFSSGNATPATTSQNLSSASAETSRKRASDAADQKGKRSTCFMCPSQTSYECSVCHVSLCVPPKDCATKFHTNSLVSSKSS